MPGGSRPQGVFDVAVAIEAIGNIKGIGKVKLKQIRMALMAAGAKEIEK